MCTAIYIFLENLNEVKQKLRKMGKVGGISGKNAACPYFDVYFNDNFGHFV